LACTVTTARAQDRRVTGRVTNSADNQPVPGATVQVKGAATGTTTDVSGNYSISVRPGGSLIFSSVGYKTQEVAVGNQNAVNVALTEDAASLSEVVVTGYSTQQKKDITGAVTVIKTKDLLSVPAASFTQQLEGRAAGVTVGTSGEPGAGVSVRIRGIASFSSGGNDPLVIIDGTPVRGEYLNSINPNDIESLQVLKDASAASIYGSRANGGVIIITTKRGVKGQTKVTYDGFYGVASDASRRIRMLNPTEYADLLWQSYQNVGQTPPSALFGTGAQPRLPDYIVPAGAMEGDPRVARDANGNYINYTTDIDGTDFTNGTKFVITKANKQGTDWQNEIFRAAPTQSHNLTVSGGTDKSRFAVSGNYFNQQGIVKETFFKRYTLRANSEFNIKKNIRIGESFQFNYIDELKTPGGNQREGNVFTKSLQHHAIVPIFDVNGGPASNKAPGIGTGETPLAAIERQKDNSNVYTQLLGNVYSEVDFLKHFTARSQFNLQYGTGWNRFYTFRRYEVSEPNAANSYGETSNYSTTWTWSNTLTYAREFGAHNVKAYVGTEAIKNANRFLTASRNNFFIDDPIYRALDRGERNQTNGGNGGTSSLFSVFARADYAYADKYLLSATIRRDGSSRIGYNNPYGTFPALSLGWRISRESFMRDLSWLSDLKVRAGWGKTGNQEIDPSNSYSFFGGSIGGTSYDISGTSNSVTPGYAIARFGNPDVRWETSASTNLGIDATLLNGKIDFTFDVYQRRTTDLLFNQRFPATAGLGAAPSVNIGDMENRGFDLAINYRGNLGSDLRFDVGVNASHYRNEILKVNESEDGFFADGFTRFGPISRGQKGQPIGAFYGYVVQGIFQNVAEVRAAATQPGIDKQYPDPFVTYDTPNGPVRGQGVGRFRFADINNDGTIDEKDQTFIGNPHPKLTYGLNINVSYKQFDFTAFFQGVYGNDIFFYNRWWTDFNSFQVNRSAEMLYNSWRPDRPDARLPLLDNRDSFANNFANSYYIQKGSYFRAKSIVLGYRLPNALATRLGLDNARVYVQGQNLFTVTKYEGMDPAFLQNADGGDGRDRVIGIDQGNYPMPRTFLVGLNLTF
jgi:TonB-linked SusC/RagA family outer membrane protein